MQALPGLIASTGITPSKIISKAGEFVGNVLSDVGGGKVNSFGDFMKSLAKSGARVLKGKPVEDEIVVVTKKDPHETKKVFVEEHDDGKNREIAVKEFEKPVPQHLKNPTQDVIPGVQGSHFNVDEMDPEAIDRLYNLLNSRRNKLANGRSVKTKRKKKKGNKRNK